MDLEIKYIFEQNTPYTLENGIPQAGGTNFVIRIVNCLNLIRFTSNVGGVSCVKMLKRDSNPNADYYNATVSANGTGSSRLVNIYGYSLRAGSEDGILVFSVYQNG